MLHQISGRNEDNNIDKIAKVSGNGREIIGKNHDNLFIIYSLLLTLANLTIYLYYFFGKFGAISFMKNIMKKVLCFMKVCYCN